MANWIRLWEDMPNDPKWRVIANRAGRPIAEVMAVFVHMMTNAGANANERGVLENWSDEDVAAALDIETENVEAIRNAMQDKVIEDNRLLGWEKRQPKREDGAAERAKAWRERKRTQANAEERPDADADADKKINNSAAAPRQRDRAFEEFWQAYPRREGANPKEPARKKFDQALKSGVEFGEIMAGAKAYAASMAGKEPRFVAQAVTWLNQSRWQDDYRPVGAHDPPKVTRLEFFPDGSRVPDRDREPEAFFAAMAEYRQGGRGKMNVG